MDTLEYIPVKRSIIKRAMKASGKRSAQAAVRYALEVIAGVKHPAYEPDDGAPSDADIAAIRATFPQALGKNAKSFFA